MKETCKTVVSKIGSFTKTFKAAQVTTYASSAAFYIFLSIILFSNSCLPNSIPFSI